ncbi:MAG TPA: hypothetical protein P5186_27110, partial [Candidatus Paceibacterota bacterium]|nr:hypothetical protein [Verrucomicrobiota bacterium]HRY51725.1 hypothetical protein [Candidatus Paceibacterota bacterium]
THISEHQQLTLQSYRNICFNAFAFCPPILVLIGDDSRLGFFSAVRGAGFRLAKAGLSITLGCGGQQQ